MRERRRFDTVVIGSGHMIDRPDRATPRFPPSRETAVRGLMAMVLDEWAIGPGSLALTGGARGADILFSELCLERGAQIRLLIALPEEEFLDRSVRLDGSDWEQRFHDLRRHCETWFAHEMLGPLPEAVSPFARTNLWMIETGQAEAPPGGFDALLVWDGQPTGDGSGGTAHVASEVRRRGGRLAIVNPTTMMVTKGATSDPVPER